MYGWAVTFLLVALVAGMLGLAGWASQSVWILFVVGLILAAVFFAKSRPLNL